MNDIEKAIEDLKGIKLNAETYAHTFDKHNENRVQTFALAISALEKQTPKKPDFIDSEIFKCPACGWKRSISDIHFCPTCGQAIDWSVES